ncbi:MptD family putative ECF transporter S component [Staphylococcus sp. 18_1_E_LY]|uniref:MptD family putative ECF transporter S component n=1 Tax=Staphylococcus lloydii TaxID=2781774 RepID=A0A7T1B028_9STAP|nr:MptD family putative ECF transporter S component [Staphylococcus lloydii]MBF7019914.1 MptD family putative ECF transporter S component [Staphylococcus lloydii]MBF7027597.1 MptD family putative ECF transporter S component [Staphylococcus lloydii]QPM75284.1 MptD family putative ECF transporter S component [Staphylococcus lloydii]
MNKLSVKDLITVGIFTAIYLVVFFVTFMIGYIPFLIPFLGLICPIICGIPFILYVMKIDKFGMVTLTGTILGIAFTVMGSGLIMIPFGILCGLIGDLLMKSGNYKNWKSITWGYAIFSLWMMGFVVRMFIARDQYFKEIAKSYGQDYVDILESITPIWTLPVMFILTIIGGLIGAWLGKKMFGKHFKKAGLV